MLRQERLQVYVDALAHAVDRERKLDAVWASSGEHVFKISPEPPGSSSSLSPWDDTTVKMRLLADEDVEQAWEVFVSAWERWQWWAEVEYSGAPDEDAPEELTQPLREAIATLKTACRRSLQ